MVFNARRMIFDQIILQQKVQYWSDNSIADKSICWHKSILWSDNSIAKLRMPSIVLHTTCVVVICGLCLRCFYSLTIAYGDVAIISRWVFEWYFDPLEKLVSGTWMTKLWSCNQLFYEYNFFWCCFLAAIASSAHWSRDRRTSEVCGPTFFHCIFFLCWCRRKCWFTRRLARLLRSADEMDVVRVNVVDGWFRGVSA